MEFKGTKGTWFKNGKNGIHTKNGSCVAWIYSDELLREYDTQLIVNSKRMMDMLKEANRVIEILDENNPLINEIEKLIKEATTI